MILAAADLDITTTEHSLAELTIALLRDDGLTDTDILDNYTHPEPVADRAYELAYHRDHGVRIAARRIKAVMKRLLRH